MSEITLHELILDPSEEAPYFLSLPNGWKAHLSILHKGLSVKLQTHTHWDIKNNLSARNGGNRTTSPAIDLEDGSLLCDSFAIAEYLEAKFPDKPSLFSGSLSHDPAAVLVGKQYARFINAGLGDSDPQWAVWLELSVADLAARIPQDSKYRKYFTSDAKWGETNGFEKMVKRTRDEDLVGRAKLNVLPLVAALKSQPFLQGSEPGFVDYVVFGRYAMCRNANPALAKQVWEDQGVEIAKWVESIVGRYPSIAKHLRAHA
ncbi:hypothetical protein BJ741DRAFT_598592 [Chytriomyces cf. hyalinus JEL632]|nr:hypothetical protein BJ741DRAFT_598592 [Chytriomyces cf. hyalinus JEL632]